jgi:hypothetical protein
MHEDHGLAAVPAELPVQLDVVDAIRRHGSLP